MRLVIVAVAALICWGQTVPLSAAEAVRLPVLCSYVANKVVLVPSPTDEMHAIVGDREHKYVRACMPGLGGRCRIWEVYRFDMMCGGRRVSWHLVAAQLQNLPAAVAKREVSLRSHLEPWEARLLLAETEFAPVEEFGGRILPVEAKHAPQSAGRDTVVARSATTTEGPTPSPGSTKLDSTRLDSHKLELEAASPKAELPETAEEVSALQPASLQPPPAERGDAKPGDAKPAVVVAPPSDGPKRDINPAPGAGVVAADAAGAAVDALPADKPAAPPRSGVANLRPLAPPPMLVLVMLALAIAGVIRWRRRSATASRRSYRGIVRVVYETEAHQPEPDSDAVAEACRDLMKQVAVELVNAMSAVNSLKGAPALQTALHTELDSIRRSLGFTQQARGASGEKKDWNQIKMQLTLGLQGTQRIIGIAEAARTSFSHPAALEVITTRLEAYAFLGVNASASEMVLKKAVNALRQCWHPDLATDEEDRRLREIRIKQINMAWDLISRKQMSAC